MVAWYFVLVALVAGLVAGWLARAMRLLPMPTVADQVTAATADE